MYDESSHSGIASFAKLVLVLGLLGGISYLIYWAVTKDKDTTSAPTSSTTTTTTTLPPPDDNGNQGTSAPSGGLKVGEIIGIVVGGLVGFLILVAVYRYFRIPSNDPEELEKLLQSGSKMKRMRAQEILTSKYPTRGSKIANISEQKIENLRSTLNNASAVVLEDYYKTHPDKKVRAYAKEMLQLEFPDRAKELFVKKRWRNKSSSRVSPE